MVQMPRVRALAGLLCVTLSSVGCLSSSTLVKVRPDGSGTVEQLLLINRQTFENIGGLIGAMGGAEGQKGGKPTLPSVTDMLDVAKLKEAASRLGPGVRYLSSEPVKQGELEGARAVFAFDDINTLKVDQGPGGKSKDANDVVLFTLAKQPGGTSVLTVTLPEPPADADRQPRARESDAPQIPPEAMGMLRPFLQDLHMAVALQVDGAIVKTNADTGNVEGSRVTLLDIAFAPILDNPAAFEKLTRLGPGASVTDVKAAMKNVPGIKVNTATPVTIEFK